MGASPSAGVSSVNAGVVEPSAQEETLESLISLHGPNEHMQGVPRTKAFRADMSIQEEAALSKMRRLCASILKKLAPPLLREIESAKALRLESNAVTPRRITRAASTAIVGTPAPRKSKKVIAAETVLLKALGITGADLEVSDEDLADFRVLFDSPVRDQHLRAMAAIFGKTVPDSMDVASAAGVVLVR
jgi:hypothetical protein